MYTWNPYNTTGKVVLATSPAEVVKMSTPLSPRSSQGISDGESFPSFCELPIATPMDTEAYDTLVRLRNSKKDSTILNNTKRLPKKMKERLCKLLANSSTLVVENCMEQRGNVVAAVLQIASEEECSRIINAVMDEVYTISCSKAGCIAMCRVYDAVASEQQAALAVSLMKYFISLSVHDYGNYVVQHLLRESVSVTRMICFSAAVSALEEPHGLYNIACNKFGSHVLEVVLSASDEELFMRLFLRFMQDAAAVTFLVHDSFANYGLQRALRRVISIDSELQSYCSSVVTPFLSTSQHAKNILLAME